MDGNDTDLELEGGYLVEVDDGADVVYQGQGHKRLTRVYRLGDYVFHRDKVEESTGTQYLRCKEFRTSHRCRARATANIGSNQLSQERVRNREHNHPGNLLYGELLKKRRELIDRCLHQTANGASLKRIFINFVKDEVDKPLQPYFNFERFKKAIDRRRAIAMGNAKCPRTFEAVHDLMEHPDYGYLGRTKDDKELLYQGMVGEPGDESIIFSSPRLLKAP